MFNTTDGFALDVFVVDGWNNDVSSWAEMLHSGILHACMHAAT